MANLFIAFWFVYKRVLADCAAIKLLILSFCSSKLIIIMEEKEVYRAPPQEQNYHIYQGLSPTSFNCNIEEVTPTKKQASWSTPFIVLTVLLCLILTLMVIIFCIILAHVSSRDSPDPACTGTSIGATAVSNVGMLNSSQWAVKVSLNLLLLAIPTSLSLMNKSYKLQGILQKN